MVQREGKRDLYYQQQQDRRHQRTHQSFSLPAPGPLQSFHPVLTRHKQVSQAPRALPSFFRLGKALQAEGLAKLKSRNKIPPSPSIIVHIKYFINAISRITKAECIVKEKASDFSPDFTNASAARIQFFTES